MRWANNLKSESYSSYKWFLSDSIKQTRRHNHCERHLHWEIEVITHRASTLLRPLEANGKTKAWRGTNKQHWGTEKGKLRFQSLQMHSQGRVPKWCILHFLKNNGSPGNITLKVLVVTWKLPTETGYRRFRNVIGYTKRQGAAQFAAGLLQY